jgi:hypothetical protein
VKKTAISATGRSRMLMIAHFTMAVFPPADVVGVGAGIVYGLAEAQVFRAPVFKPSRLKPRSAQGPLPAKSTDAPLDGRSRVLTL